MQKNKSQNLSHLVQNPEETILLIDGSSFIFRAFHAIPDLNSPNGKPTNATYGVINMLKQLKKKIPTNHIACVFDAPGKNFRDEIYPEYKATRRETPANLRPQFEDIYTLVKALGIPLIMENGIEADDIIGAIAIHAKNHNKKILIATGDKDFAQLVDESIVLVNTMTNEILDVDGVIDKFGVKPAQIIDYLALIGDKIDNIPGVEKCGPKTAAKWLNEYGNLDNLIENRDQLTGVVGENFRKAQEWLPIARKLITINTNIDGFTMSEINSLIYSDPNLSILKKVYHELGFKTWLKEINFDANNYQQAQTYATMETIPSTPPKTQIIITNAHHLEEIINNIINENQAIAILIIGNIYPTPTDILEFAFSTATTSYVVFNETLSNTDLFNNSQNDYITSLMKLLNSKVPKVFANYKECLKLLKICNYPNYEGINNVVDDLTLLHYLKNSKTKHNMSTIFKEILALDTLDLPTINTKYPKDSRWNNVRAPHTAPEIFPIIDNIQIIKEQLLENLSEKEITIYKNIELPLTQVLVDIEIIGIQLDLPQFKHLEDELSKRLQALENEIYKASGSVFNINSPKQLQQILFEILQLPTAGIKKNSNTYSTDEDSLKLLETQGFTIATLLLEYRALTKLLTTYVSKLPALVDTQNRLHTTFEQALVASGRLSSNNPNLQNIPIKSSWGKRIRQAFVAKPGYKLICADYSQIELRILADISQDENLINAFNTDSDIHTITACELFNKTEDRVTSDERRYAKTINFSLLYGKTAFGLAQELNIDRATAKSYIDTYFAKYPKVMHTLNRLKQFAHDNGYVETILGRRIYLANINASNRILREAEERLALNAPMQGTSADIIKIAMCNLHSWLKKNAPMTHIILQVHDELILEAPENDAELIATTLKNIMLNALKLSVKLQVDVKIADNWNDAH